MVQILNHFTEEEKSEIELGLQTENYNIFDMFLQSVFNKYANKLGTVFPQSRDKNGRIAYTHVTYEQMNEECDRYAHGFVERGVRSGTKVLLLVRPSLEFTIIFGSLFKIGAIPVLIDPGMGIRPMLKSMKSVNPDVFIGISLAHLARVFGPKYFNSVKLSITIGRRWLWGGPCLRDLRSSNTEPYPIFQAKKDDIAGIFFTTGSTGMPKGVVYTHEMFCALAHTIQNFFHFDESTIDMPAFPPFALFSMAFGGTSVIPEMDPTQPAKADPEKLLHTIRDFGVNLSYGSPSIWSRVSEYCEKNHVTLPTMKSLLMFGAPVPGIVLERFRTIMPNGEACTPYGATEALFVSNISGAEVCEETFALSKKGKGTCVGHVIPGIALKIIQISDDVITLPREGIDGLTVPQGAIGEIVVSGPYITQEYYNMPVQTAKAKIHDGKTVWHRMGDLGYLDEKNRLWFVGRKSHRINRDGTEYYNAMVEGYFNQLEGVTRSAMVGVYDPVLGQRMVMIIQLDQIKGFKQYRNKKSREEFFRAFANQINLPVDAFLFRKKIPVDIRHNAKIKNDILALWAEQKLKGKFEK